MKQAFCFLKSALFACSLVGLFLMGPLAGAQEQADDPNLYEKPSRYRLEAININAIQTNPLIVEQQKREVLAILEEALPKRIPSSDSLDQIDLSSESEKAAQ